MQQKFQSGDLVKLKSGGPSMTVESYHSPMGVVTEQVYCSWFVNGEKRKEIFHEDAVEKVTDLPLRPRLG